MRTRKKETGLDWQNNNFAGASHFFVHFFFAVIARLRRENAYFQVLWKTWTQEKTFCSWTSIQSFRIQLQKKFANSWRIERDRTRCSATSLISTLRWQPFAGTWTIFYLNKSDNVDRYLLISLDTFLPYYKPSSTDWAVMIELHREGQVGDLSYNWNIFLATETYPIGPLASE